MMDEREDRLDATLRDAARDYNAPPATPKAELWDRIAAARAAGPATAGRPLRTEEDILPFRSPARRVRPTIRLALGLAALLALGVAIGRMTAPGTPALPAVTPVGTGLATAPSERSSVAAQVVTVQHLGRVESFLTEFSATDAARDFTPQAQELLSTTRLLLDSGRLTDVRTRKLLEDLELVLVQIATLNRDRREDLGFIADGLAQSQLRTRIRNAIPTGPAARM